MESPASPGRSITMLINEHCELAENPLWCTEDGCLYWTDITGRTLHRLRIKGGSHEILHRGETVGGFTFQESGGLLLFRVKDVALLRPDGGLEILLRFEDEGSERFNDVIADPEGRVFAGTIGKSEQGGGLWRVDTDGMMTMLFRGTGCSNGMGFSPDLTKFYWTCSTRGQIREFDYDRATGGLSRERLLYQAGADEGIPDGLTVDSKGDIWSARWDGHAVIRHAPDGTVLERIPFPVRKITSLCFGGARMEQLFVTSAGGAPGRETLDGAVFQFSSVVNGPAEFKSRISVQR